MDATAGLADTADMNTRHQRIEELLMLARNITMRTIGEAAKAPRRNIEITSPGAIGIRSSLGSGSHTADWPTQCARLLPLPAAYKVASMAAFGSSEYNANKSSREELRCDWLCMRMPLDFRVLTQVPINRLKPLHPRVCHFSLRKLAQP